MVCGCLSYPFQQFVLLKSFFKFLECFSLGLRLIKGHATRNDIVDISSSTMAFNVAKILYSVQRAIVNDIVDEIVTCRAY